MNHIDHEGIESSRAEKLSALGWFTYMADEGLRCSHCKKEIPLGVSYQYHNRHGSWCNSCMRKVRFETDPARKVESVTTRWPNANDLVPEETREQLQEHLQQFQEHVTGAIGNLLSDTEARLRLSEADYRRFRRKQYRSISMLRTFGLLNRFSRWTRLRSEYRYNTIYAAFFELRRLGLLESRRQGHRVEHRLKRNWFVLLTKMFDEEYQHQRRQTQSDHPQFKCIDIF